MRHLINFKKIYLLICCILICSINLCAQKWASFIGDKLTPLKEGNGFVVKDFNHFKGNTLGSIYPFVMEEISDDSLVSLKIKADSLGKQLLEKGTLSMLESDLNILPYFNIFNSEEIVVANLVFTVSRLGAVKSLNYEVLKGDTLTITYMIIEGAGFDEVEIIEGKEVRFNLSKNKKNKEIKTTLIAVMDGAIAINLTNRGILRSKGNLIITKKSAQKKIAFKYQSDTLFNQVKVKRILHDTLFEDLYNQSISIPSSIDITRSNKLSIPINFEPNKSYFAWAYWIGSKNIVNQEWSKQVIANGEKGPLATYLFQELSKNGFIQLPEEKHPDLKFSIQNSMLNTLRSYDGTYKGDKLTTPSLNKRNNYAGYTIKDPNIPFGLSVTLENSSTLYKYDVLINVVGMFTNSYETEEEVTETTLQEYLIISVL